MTNELKTRETAETWLRQNAAAIQEIQKPFEETRAWFAEIDDQQIVAKWFPTGKWDRWVDVELAIAGPPLHPAIVPLLQVVRCQDGHLGIFKRVPGENLGPQENRARFARLPAAERRQAAITVCEALCAIVEAGFTVVDWYEGNMLYDFDAHRIWLFDWELCLPGSSFILEMDNNWGSSRLMAPEEFIRGSVIDETSLVFNLGRYVLINVPELAEPMGETLASATHPSRKGRFPTVRAFLDALQRG